MRIELTQSAWKAEVLPLNYICNLVGISNYTRNLMNVNIFLKKSDFLLIFYYMTKSKKDVKIFVIFITIIMVKR